MTPVSTRLVRLLNMVPYFQANPRVTRAQAASELGVSVKQLDEDLDQLWLCGLPGYGPGDLIDFEFTGDTIEVTFSAGMDTPLKLTSPEATGLLVALRALADIPGVVDPAAARSAIAKIEAAAGAVGRKATASVAAVDEPAPVEDRVAGTVRAAVQSGHALSIDYYPRRDVRELPDGSCEAVMTYASDDWMTRLVLGFGPAVQVVEPESLAHRVRDAAQAALAGYRAASQG